MINYVKFNSLTLRAKGRVVKLLFKNLHKPGAVWIISSSGMPLRFSSNHISSRSLEVGFLTQADWQMTAGAVLVCFGAPPVGGICGLTL